MAHKHHKHQQRTAAALPPDELERKAQESLAAGRWRQARDAFKLLCKNDRAKYLPGLIQANRGLAEELMQKGQISEAEQVIAYLRTLAPQEDFGAIEMQRVVRAGDWSGAMEEALKLWKSRGDSLSEQDRQKVADALVLGFPELDAPTGGLDLPDSLRNELSAVLGALKELSEGDYEQAQELLRPLPRASLFAAWKTFVKAWIALYSGARDKAQQLVSMLPPDSVPGRAAVPIRTLCNPRLLIGLPSGERDRAAASVCTFLGAPEIGRVLIQADEIWKTGKVVESFQLMRRAREFPSCQPTLAGVLSEFYFRIGFTLEGEAENRYFHALDRLASTGSFKNGAEKFLIERLRANDELSNSFVNPEPWWRDFLKHFETHPLRAKLTSLALQKIAGTLDAKPSKAPFGFGMRPSASHPQQAIRLLTESIQEDPKNLSAHLQLLEVYERKGSTPERNRLLDKMTRIFPDEKPVLLQAGLACLNRNAFVKALESFQRARELDPLDPKVLECLVLTRIDFATDQYRKKQTVKARQNLEKLAEFAVDDRVDFVRGRDFLHARQGVLEVIFGEKDRGEELIAEARRATRSLPALLLFVHGVYRIYYEKRGRKMEETFWLGFCKSAPANPRERKDLFLVLEYLRKTGCSLEWRREITKVGNHLSYVAGKAFTPEEASELVLLIAEHPDFSTVANRLIDAGRKHNPKSPRFRLLAFRREFAPPVGRIGEIEEIRRDALREGDQISVKIADRLLEELRDFAKMDEEGDGDEFGDYDDDDEDEPGNFDEDGPGGLPLDKIEEMKRLAATMTDEEFAAFRKESAKFIPLRLFDTLIGRRVKPKSKARKASKDDQMDLF